MPNSASRLGMYAQKNFGNFDIATDLQIVIRSRRAQVRRVNPVVTQWLLEDDRAAQR